MVVADAPVAFSMEAYELPASSWRATARRCEVSRISRMVNRSSSSRKMSSLSWIFEKTVSRSLHLGGSQLAHSASPFRFTGSFFIIVLHHGGVLENSANRRRKRQASTMLRGRTPWSGPQASDRRKAIPAIHGEQRAEGGDGQGRAKATGQISLRPPNV